MTDQIVCRRLVGRTAVITGAGSGIGLATARRLASEGANVVCADVDETRGKAAADDHKGVHGDSSSQMSHAASRVSGGSPRQTGQLPGL